MKQFDIRKFLKEQTISPLQLKKLLKEQNDPAAEERLSSEHVNYFGPEKGPFKCGHCKFFNEEKSYCQHPEVRAFTQPEGCCNEFQPSTK